MQNVSNTPETGAVMTYQRFSVERLNEWVSKRGDSTYILDLLDTFCPPDLKPSRQLLHNWLSGASMPSIVYLPALCKALGCGPLDLFEEEEVN